MRKIGLVSSRFEIKVSLGRPGVTMTTQDQKRERERKSATCSLFPPVTWGPLSGLPTEAINTLEALALAFPSPLKDVLV